jgi:hypothetical protein
MTRTNNPKNYNQFEAPGSWSGGLQFDLFVPPATVILVSLLIVFILSRLSTDAPSEPKKHPNTTGKIAPLFTAEVQYWGYKIEDWGKKYNLDPNLIATVMQIESCGHQNAKSNAGAMGLFQVMPYHFSDGEDPYKPNINARRGLTYLKRSLEAGNSDIRLALAGYNGGITGASRPDSEWSRETSRFAYWGEGIYTDAARGKSQSDRLDEWLSAGGTSLCRSAAESLGLNP